MTRQRHRHRGFDTGFPDRDRCEQANHAAVFHPMTDADTLPCIEVAGVQVYVDLDAARQVFRVTVNVETADPALLRPDGTVPLRLMVGDAVILDTTTGHQPPPAHREGGGR